MEQLSDGDVFFFRVPTQMKPFLENPESAKDIGEVLFAPGSSSLVFKLVKRRREGQQVL